MLDLPREREVAIEGIRVGIGVTPLFPRAIVLRVDDKVLNVWSVFRLDIALP
jgi:hypothetical protein